MNTESTNGDQRATDEEIGEIRRYLRIPCNDDLIYPAQMERVLARLADAEKRIDAVACYLEDCTKLIGSDGDWQGRCGAMAKRLRGTPTHRKHPAGIGDKEE